MSQPDTARGTASDVAHRLARNAEAVCRHYLPNGKREGRYWLVGDVADTPGRSLFVRLSGADHGQCAAGKWSDAATGEHGDLLDLIAANRRCATLRETLAEARQFLSLPQPEVPDPNLREPAPQGSPEAARRLWAISKPVHGTPAETYLRGRELLDLTGLRLAAFSPALLVPPNEDDAPNTRDAWPAIIAAIRNVNGDLTGVHRTWLAPAGTGKAPVATPRRALGHLLGHGIWFGRPGAVMIAGEGIETVLSLRQILPAMPMVAGISANHLAALPLFSGLRRLYVALDNDPAGDVAFATLSARADEVGVEAIPLNPALGDFNDDLCQLGRSVLAARVRKQLLGDDDAKLLTTQGS